MKDSSSLIKFRSMVLILIGALIVLFIIPISLWNTYLFSTYMDLLTPIVSFFAAGLLIYTAACSYMAKNGAFRAWIVLFLAMFLYSFASLFYFVLDSFNSFSLFNISDMIYMAAYPLLLIGLFLLMNKPFKIKYKDFLDVVIVMVSIFFIVWFYLIWPTVGPSQPNTISDLLSISYLFLDLVVLLAVLLLAFNENRKIRDFSVALFSLGMFLQILGDMIYAYNAVNPVLAYNWLFTMFYTANSFLIIGAIAGYLNNIDTDLSLIYSYKEKTLQNYLFSYLPLILVLFTYSLLIITTPSPALIWGVGVVVSLVILRQIIYLNEIKNAQKVLKMNKELISEKKEQLSFITSNTVDLITELDNKGILKYVSPSSAHVLGYLPEYMVGKSIYIFIHPDDEQRMRDLVKESLESLVDMKLQYRAKNAREKYIWMESVGKPFFENNNLKGFIYSSRDITERKNSEEFVKKSLNEKEALLKEIHHRVNNNLQIIISLLNLQSRNVVDKKDAELFFESQNRVKSMAMIYEKLYQSDDLNYINFSDYLKTLINHLMYTYSQNLYRVNLELDIDEINLNIETSVPCGLIINELVSNSLKHAFPFGRKGKITVEMHNENEEYVLLIGDNGVGFSMDLEINHTNLGLSLVYSLIDQLDATIERLDGKGTFYKIKFMELKYEGRI
ncbi:sensor histidine kinase [Methanobacterium alcaliphilum]|uniref:sensor histidine kinase n=1 Tax=Methanobacterium alcaliphilum TaxID=392018 RepID=UPI00200A1062|nr:histidine kinase dimerization/phosphoacceptor domain -containing protein [Methanobacterium alcaliphilum]MCK9151977.1 PAS domain S-box protein [Methanobacterium alcaliphilum]